jgi:TRAP-type C4-dicarboxylate transport system permease small subunit
MENKVESSHDQKAESGLIVSGKTMLTKLLDIIQRVLYSVIGLLVLLMISSNVLQVFYRYVLHASLRWPEEISIFTMMWVTMLGGAVLSRRGAHISMDFIMSRLSGKSKRLLLGIIFALCLVFYVPMVYFGYKFSALTWGYVSPSTHLSMGMLYSSVPVGFFLMIIFTLEAASVDLKRK